METILQSGIVKKKQRKNQETCLGICQQYKGHCKITTETLLTINNNNNNNNNNS